MYFYSGTYGREYERAYGREYGSRVSKSLYEKKQGGSKGRRDLHYA